MHREPENSTPGEDWRAFVDGMSSFTRADALAWALAWPLLLLNVLQVMLVLSPLSVAKNEVRSDTEYLLAAAGLTIWFTFGILLLATV